MHGSSNKFKTARNIALTGAVTGNANFDGSGDVVINTTQNNVCVIEGELELNANSSENLGEERWLFTNKTINYPEGYNKTNCVVIAFGTINKDYYEQRGYAFGDETGGNVYAVAMLLGDVPRNASLFSDGIHISIGNFATSPKTFKYKIVLLKVS